MKRKSSIVRFAVAMLVLLAFSACKKEKPVDPEEDLPPVVGHWGCEQYVSCRDSLGFEDWDTIPYEVGPDKGIEVFFLEDGSGKLWLNESPAMIKKFNCSYYYDAENKQVVIEAPGMLYLIYQSVLALNENRAVFDIEQITDSTMVASWTNEVSETIPFFERFFLKRID